MNLKKISRINGQPISILIDKFKNKNKMATKQTKSAKKSTKPEPVVTYKVTKITNGWLLTVSTEVEDSYEDKVEITYYTENPLTIGK